MQGQYWKFYWPLALTGLGRLLAKQFENGVLASYEHGTEEIATYAFAISTLMQFGVLVAFVPQMANVLARCRRAHAVCLRFVLGLCVVVTLPVALLAMTAPGEAVIAAIYDIDGRTLADVMTYLRLLMPLLVMQGLSHYLAGLLIQDRHTRSVTALTGVHVGATIAMLLLGRGLGWPAVQTLVAAQLIAAGLHLALSWLVYVLRYRLPADSRHEDLDYTQVLAFFWPVAVTGVMFALSRPVLYAFLKRTSGGEAAVAAVKVAFDFAMLFQILLNQFRHFFATFGEKDLPGMRRFMTVVTVALGAAMLAVACTPAARFIFQRLMKVEPLVVAPAATTLMVLCGIPLIISIRNYYHGQLLTRRRTGGMAVGGVLRVATLYLVSWALFRAGWFNHVAAAAILQLGFAAETVIAALAVRRSAPGDPGSAAEAAAGPSAGADVEDFDPPNS